MIRMENMFETWRRYGLAEKFRKKGERKVVQRGFAELKKAAIKAK